jgi:predicted ATPase
MTRRRDMRRFGPGPYLLGLRRVPERWRDGFPFDVPAVAAVEDMRLDAPVTLLAGDNGTGKSTLVEAIAAAIGFGEEGGELQRSGELPAVPRAVLDGALEPVLSNRKPSLGYFLRAESFFNIAKFVDGGGTFAPDLSLYGDVPLHEQSHGQSFLALASNRFGGEGFYVLDEPEAALSATGAIALLAIIVRAAKAGAQFVVATHSPILLACPGARIYELDDAGLAPCAYDDLDAVRFTRGFLDAPERFIRAALQDDG